MGAGAGTAVPLAQRDVAVGAPREPVAVLAQTERTPCPCRIAQGRRGEESCAADPLMGEEAIEGRAAGRPVRLEIRRAGRGLALVDPDPLLAREAHPPLLRQER